MIKKKPPTRKQATKFVEKVKKDYDSIPSDEFDKKYPWFDAWDKTHPYKFYNFTPEVFNLLVNYIIIRESPLMKALEEESV